MAQLHRVGLDCDGFSSSHVSKIPHGLAEVGHLEGDAARAGAQRKDKRISRNRSENHNGAPTFRLERAEQLFLCDQCQALRFIEDNDAVPRNKRVEVAVFDDFLDIRGRAMGSAAHFLVVEEPVQRLPADLACAAMCPVGLRRFAQQRAGDQLSQQGLACAARSLDRDVADIALRKRGQDNLLVRLVPSVLLEAGGPGQGADCRCHYGFPELHLRGQAVRARPRWCLDF